MLVGVSYRVQRYRPGGQQQDKEGTDMIRRKISLKGVLSLILATLVIILTVSCATVYYGLLMKGSIIEASSSEVYLCIGSRDGASVGQELDVYKIIKIKEPRPTLFQRVLTGKVKITEIVDEHFARATVISGKAEENDIVELTRPK
jgi:hypothetical protein